VPGSSSDEMIPKEFTNAAAGIGQNWAGRVEMRSLELRSERICPSLVCTGLHWFVRTVPVGKIIIIINSLPNFALSRLLVQFGGIMIIKMLLCITGEVIQFPETPPTETRTGNTADV